MKFLHATAIAVLSTSSLSAQNINVGVYGGAGAYALPTITKQAFSNTKTTPLFGIRLSTEINRFQAGIDMSTWKLSYTHHTASFDVYTSEGVMSIQQYFNGHVRPLSFKVFGNYRFGKDAAHFFIGANGSYNAILTSNAQFNYRQNGAQPALLVSRDKGFWGMGIQAGYRRYITKDLSLQFETGVNRFSTTLNTPVSVHGEPARDNYFRNVIFQIPVTVGVNYTF